MPDSYLDLVVTSPPYDNLRDYHGFPEFNLLACKKLAKLLYKKLKDGGVVVWIVNDAVIDGSKTLTSFKQSLIFRKAGFLVNDTMIWCKDAIIPQPQTGVPRYYQAFEYMFIFSKGKPKTFNRIRDRKNRHSGKRSGKQKYSNSKIHIGKNISSDSGILISEYGYRYNWWVLNKGFESTKDKIAYQHPAVFSEKLAKDHIISWSNEGDIVYDPFMGSGTVAKACINLNRIYIGSEISSKYCEIAEKRLQHVNPILL